MRAHIFKSACTFNISGILGHKTAALDGFLVCSTVVSIVTGN